MPIKKKKTEMPLKPIEFVLVVEKKSAVPFV